MNSYFKRLSSMRKARSTPLKTFSSTKRRQGGGLRVPAVAIAARAEAGVRESVRRGGGEGFGGKPFPGRALVSAVDELIAAR